MNFYFPSESGELLLYFNIDSGVALSLTKFAFSCLKILLILLFVVACKYLSKFAKQLAIMLRLKMGKPHETKEYNCFP